MFDRGSKLKLTNFRFAQFSNRRNSETFFSDIVQSPEYLSPETMSGLPYKGTLQDSWSVGIVLAFLVTGKYPEWELGADGETVDFLLFKSEGCPYKRLEGRAVKDFMKMLLNVVPSKRSTVAGVVKNYIGSRNMQFVRSEKGFETPL